MSSSWYLFALTITLLVLQRVQSSPIPVDGDLAADIVSSEDVEFKVPFLPQLREVWPAEKQQFHLDRIGPIFEYMIEKVDEIVGDKIGILSKITVGSKLLAMVTKAVATRPNQKNCANVGPEFNSEVAALIGEILERGSQIKESMEDSREPINTPKLRWQFLSSLQTILEEMRASPTVGYVDWRRATVDRVGFSEYCSKIIGSLMYHGFDSVPTIIRSLRALV